MHYIYRHIRLDINKPFYIGIGTIYTKGNSYKSEYRRAFLKSKRSNFWKNITSKSKYKIEILIESNDYKFIKQKEIEFVTIYGRQDLGKGNLVNLTNGGEGTLGRVINESTIDKLKTSRKLRGAIHKVKIYQYDLQGNFIKEWCTIKDASSFCNVHISTLQKIAVNNVNNNYCKGYYWHSNYKDKVETRSYRIATFAKIEMIHSLTDKCIQIFNSKEEALRFLGKRKSGSFITNCIRNNKLAYGYKWREIIL